MVDIWDILSEILEDLGLTRYPIGQTGPSGFVLIKNLSGIGYDCYEVWSIDDRHYRIWYHGNEEISIVRVRMGNESVAVDIDLRDEDSLDMIRKIILDE